MPRLVAFLRAINVGGHVVPMADLRRVFEDLKFSSVQTFIASGNVVFETKARDLPAMERRIAAQLERTFGYPVDVFIRTEGEVAAIARYQPFADAKLAEAQARVVGFFARPLEPGEHRIVSNLVTDVDDLHVHGREIYWLCRKKQSESMFSNAVLEKALKTRSTLRGVSTITKLVEKFGFEGEKESAISAASAPRTAVPTPSRDRSSSGRRQGRRTLPARRGTDR